MRFPAGPNPQYPASNNYPNSDWPESLPVEDPSIATLCDAFGVTVGGYESEVGCVAAADGVGLTALLARVAVPVLESDANPVASAADAVPVALSARAAVPVLDTDVRLAASLTAVEVPEGTRVTFAPYATSVATAEAPTGIVVPLFASDSLEPVHELEVAC